MKTKEIVMCDGWTYQYRLCDEGIKTILLLEKSHLRSGCIDIIEIYDSDKHKPLTELRNFLNDNKNG